MTDRHARGTVLAAVDQLHDMVLTMELLPGQPMRQEALAVRLGTSRAGVREALRVLESEGILEYRRNIGYAVARLTASQLEQAYLIRKALETEVFRALPPLGTEQLDELARINDELALAGERREILTALKLNQKFHFTIFRASGLDLVVDELLRIWQLTDAYRAVYLYDQAARERIVAEHTGLIEALRRGDTEALIRLADDHRGPIHDQIGPLLKHAATR
ncbi:GntR family transcriptional regulator [Pseudonocardia spinosispora]|uniref:GntR family transcriptional regulator n=1 Tax=Pseudonocardia spinosispora TaxID=103441 RepID=UPI000413ECBD|nr:GntR family transcriptional regulator [Pseudonocardia spinosispora]